MNEQKTHVYLSNISLLLLPLLAIILEMWNINMGLESPAVFSFLIVLVAVIQMCWGLIRTFGVWAKNQVLSWES